MSARAVEIQKSLKANLPAGKNYRLVCLTGKNKGKAYLMNHDRVVMGRSVSADIVIFDGKSSKNHAELKRVGDDYILSDLGSRNGIYIDDLRISQHALKKNDRFVIGQTVYKYEVIEVEGTELEKVKESPNDNEDEAEPPKKEDKNKNKRIIYIVLLGALAYLFLDGEPEVETKPKRRALSDLSLNNLSDSGLSKRDDLDPEIAQKLESIIHRGQREYRERNYFRAMSEFRHALTLDPENASASYYLQQTKQSLDEEIQGHFDAAKRAIESIKYNNAIVNYCSVLRLLQDYPQDQRVLDAKKNIEVVEDKRGLKPGEVKCF